MPPDRGHPALAAAVPAAALLLLLATGTVRFVPGLLALLATLAAAVPLLRAGAAPPAPPVPAATPQPEAQPLADTVIVEELPDPVLLLDAERHPVRANRAARLLFGAPLAGAPGTGGGELAALLRHPILAETVDRALRDKSPQSADLVLPVPVARDLAVQVIPMRLATPDRGRLLVVLADRTRERLVERMRADFVANASHELRTPLASLIGFIETLRGPAEDDPAARTRFLGIMAEQSERMRRLIDDLLGLSRIELTEHTAPTGRAELAAIAAAEADAMTPILAARNVSLQREIDPDSPVAAPADPEQLAQVVRNLLDNAVRHGREGGTVRIAVAAVTDRNRPGVEFAVTDDGPGIPREHIPRLTERFYRVDKGRSRSAGGTGLGLAIVKHIVNRHRGRLAVESEPGLGATFRVWVPAEPASADAPARPEPGAA